MLEWQEKQLLQQLQDIYQPDSVSWWPLAPGWWLLIGGVLIISVILVRLYLRKTALRRAAFKKLHEIEQQYEQFGSLNQLTMSLNQFMRRVILSRVQYYPEFEAGINGEAWLLFLDKTMYSQHVDFSQGVGRVLIELPYRTHMAQPAIIGAQAGELLNNGKILIIQARQAQALLHLIRQWIRKNTL